MRWRIRSLAPYMQGLLLPALVLALCPGAADAGIEYVWPVPGSQDIRGTYCDYRNAPLGFHGGIDVYGPGGDDGLPVRPMVTKVRVYEPPSYEQGPKTWAVKLRSVEDANEKVVYAHVTGLRPDNRLIKEGDEFYWYQDVTRIGDFERDYDTSNDHLHFELLEPRQRNPLWDSPDYPHLPHSDATLPTIVAVAFTEYHGPYASGNLLYAIADISAGGVVHVPDGRSLDIIVYGHDDGNKVGVRALSYAVLDPWQPQPTGDQWIPFCDFTGELPEAGYVYSVYAFQRDSEGNEVLTTTSSPNDRMWYIVTNTSGTANSFDADRSWDTPGVPAELLSIPKRVWIRAVDAKGNVAVESVDAAVVPKGDISEPAVFWIERSSENIRAMWTRQTEPRAVEYRLWLRCRALGRTMLATVSATDKGESGKEVYSVEVPVGVDCPEGVYELEAVTEEFGTIPLAWTIAPQ